MKVLIYGATGSQQFPVIEALKKKKAELYAATQSEANFSKLAEAGATPVKADLQDGKKIMEITKGMDAISFLIPVSIANPRDAWQFAKNAIDAAKECKVKMFVWNTSGYMLPVRIGNQAVDVKIDVKEYLENSGVPYTIIEPPVYAENLTAPFTINYIRNERKVAYPTPEQMPIGWIATQDVAAIVAEALYKPHLAGQSFKISGLENLKGNELAEKFSIGLGEKITFYAMPPKQFGEILKPFIGEEAAKGIEMFYQGMADADPYPVLFAPDMPAILKKLPVKMTPIEEWVKMNRQTFIV
jgi:uncharacterized protein YbjT (DUF2867 family)